MIETAPGLINDYLRGVYSSVLKKDILVRRKIRNERRQVNALEWLLELAI